jgi:hypothetical protein
LKTKKNYSFTVSAIEIAPGIKKTQLFKGIVGAEMRGFKNCY